MKSQILVVEDELEIARLLEDYLNKFGYDPVLLHDGDQVLPYLQKNQPDLILLDVMLPGANGMDLCREIRKTSEIRQYRPLRGELHLRPMPQFCQYPLRQHGPGGELRRGHRVDVGCLQQRDQVHGLPQPARRRATERICRPAAPYRGMPQLS